MRALLVLLALAGVASADTYTVTTVNQTGGVAAAVVDGQLERHLTFPYSPSPPQFRVIAWDQREVEFYSAGKPVAYWRGGLLEVVGVW